MPKRKSNPCVPASVVPSLGSLDAALDILACDTFSRLDAVARKFEAAAGIQLNQGVVATRWKEAVNRYWMTKSMEQCCMAMANGAEVPAHSEVQMGDSADVTDEAAEGSGRRDSGSRPLPPKPYPGAVAVHELCEDEEREWRHWTPKIGDVVLVELPEDGIWPGKLIDKRSFFQGRTIPRGNHFFPVRIYHEDKHAAVTVKSRLIPFHLRPTPPLLASESLQSAYHHANHPDTFDMLASARESLAAHTRTHPGVGDEPDRETIRDERDVWNKMVNWVMGERRIEKLRAVTDERQRKLREVTKVDVLVEDVDGLDNNAPKKRRTSATVPLPLTDSPVQCARGRGESNAGTCNPPVTIFGPLMVSSTPSLAGHIRPTLSTPQLPISPRRFDKKRSAIYTGMGEYSPRGRGGTYTPPRILPSGDETAPRSTGSPAPSLHKFDFVSPLGPVSLRRLSSADHVPPKLMQKASLEALKGSSPLEAVREDPGEQDPVGWTVVQGKRGRRAGSLPCMEKAEAAILAQPERMDIWS